MATLKAQVAHFKAWASRCPRKSAEWETDYDFWDELWDATETTLAAPGLESEDVGLLLYTLARDNECVRVKEMMEDHIENAMRVARAALDFPDQDARWQVADFLGTQDDAEARDSCRGL